MYTGRVHVNCTDSTANISEKYHWSPFPEKGSLDGAHSYGGYLEFVEELGDPLSARSLMESILNFDVQNTWKKFIGLLPITESSSVFQSLDPQAIYALLAAAVVVSILLWLTSLRITQPTPLNPVPPAFDRKPEIISRTRLYVITAIVITIALSFLFSSVAAYYTGFDRLNQTKGIIFCETVLVAIFTFLAMLAARRVVQEALLAGLLEFLIGFVLVLEIQDYVGFKEL